MITRNNPKLHNTFWFWFALLSPISVAVVLGFSIAISSTNIEASYSAIDINNLLIQFKLPLGIASLSIPFVAMVASIHRSSQTSEQITVQTAQNNFANHFKHLEEFRSAFSSVENLDLVLWRNIEELHKYVFPLTIEGDLSPNPDIYIFPHAVSTYYHPERGVLSISIFRHTEKFFEEINPSLAIKSKRNLKPGDIFTVLDILQRSLRFSGLNPPLLDIDEEIVNEIKNQSIAYAWAEHSIMEGHQNLNKILANGLNAAYPYQKMHDHEYSVEFMETIIVLSALDCMSHHNEIFMSFFKSLSPEIKDKISNYLKFFNEILPNTEHTGSKRLSEHLKTFDSV